jgi:hypothetical protein
MDKRAYIPHCQVRNNCLVLYEVPDLPYRHGRDMEGLKLKYSGKVAAGTQKRIRKAIDIFLQITPSRQIWNPVVEVFHPFRLSFITLTIAETRRNINAKEAHKTLLRPWLDWATGQRVGARNYIWKAEWQERGQLHYHITTDVFIHYQDIQKKWNALQKKAGLLDAYAKKHGHFNPNSIDVHSVKNIADFEAYLAKYIAKGDQNGKEMDGKVWDCSARLKEKRYIGELDSVTAKNVEAAILDGKAEKVALDNCTIIRVPHPEKLLSATMQKEYSDWLQGIPPPPPPPRPAPVPVQAPPRPEKVTQLRLGF